MKKTWQKPMLVVLFRGRPEEYVLSACKSADDPEGGATEIFAGSICEQNAVWCEPCNGAGGT